MSSRVTYDFGMIGLGTMGRNLLLNMADHGIVCAGYDKDSKKAALLEKEGRSNVKGFSDIREFVASLKTTRSIMLLVPAGKIVDSVIEELLPLLDKGDILIDGGNSHFTDTDRRVEYLQSKGFHFFGMGISGGEEGARFGPSMMPGGDKAAYHVMKPTLEAIAAKAEDGTPCVTYIGRGSAGHFVKMVHNGIEYALMQLIADTYEFFQRGLGLSNQAIGEVFNEWDKGRLQSFLLEITKDIFAYKVPGTDRLLLDDIKDEAKAEGTGKWTSQVAMDLQCPTPVIDMAVSMRDLSKYKSLREQIAAAYPAMQTVEGDREKLIARAEQAFFFSMINIYAQGMHLISKASEQYRYELKPAEIARIWRAGCIIRSAFLKDIYKAYESNKNLAHLLLDPSVADTVRECEPAARELTGMAIRAGLSLPAYASALCYFDALRSKRMPSNLIQAQRDYFGAHTYELIGQEGVFHTIWHS